MEKTQELARGAVEDGRMALSPPFPWRFGPTDPTPWRTAATMLLTAVALREAVRDAGNAPPGLIKAFEDVVDWCGSTGRIRFPVPVPGPTDPPVPGWWWRARMGQEVLDQAMTLPDRGLREAGFAAAERIIAAARER